MRRKRRNKPQEPSAAKRPRRSWFMHPRAKRTLGVGLLAAFAVILVVCAVVGVRRLEAHVDGMLLLDRPDPVVEFIDLPKELYGLANYDLQKSLFDIVGREWVDDRLCGELATRLTTVGWVGRVNFVRRTGGGRFEISCRFRMPAAMVMVQGTGYLVDGEGTRLPGTYVQHSAWRVIQGVGQSPPEPGVRWDGDDIRAGLAVLSAVRTEPFSPQIAGVLVENHAGRRDPRACHLELVTDRPGGRIRWGSPPGLELEENGVEQKLALLRQNFGSTGRADAHEAVIDVSVFPDRYTVPG